MDELYEAFVERMSRVAAGRIVAGSVLLSICIVFALACFIGSRPIRGYVTVETLADDDALQVVRRHCLPLGPIIGHLGRTRIDFDNPIALCAIDDDLLADSKAKGYRCSIHYECLIPFFNHSKGQ